MELSKMLTSFLADCYIQLYNYIKNPLFVNNLELSLLGLSKLTFKKNSPLRDELGRLSNRIY